MWNSLIFLFFKTTTLFYTKSYSILSWHANSLYKRFDLWYIGDMKKVKSSKNNKQNKKDIKAKSTKNSENIAKFKQKYFDFYDDIKDYTNGKEDW